MSRRSAGSVAVAVLAVGVLGALGGGGWVRSEALLWADDVALPTLSIADAGDPVRGEHLARDVLQCTACHPSGDGAGDGAGTPPVAADPAVPAGPLSAWSDASLAAWARAVRQGVGFDGRALLDMPVSRWTALTDADLADLRAWSRTLHDAELPPRRTVTWRRRLDLATGRLVPPAHGLKGRTPPPGPPPAPTAAFGRHLARVAGCENCHGSLSAPVAPFWHDLRGTVTVGAAFVDRLEDAHPDDAPGVVGDPSRWTLTELDALWLAVGGPVPVTLADPAALSPGAALPGDPVVDAGLEEDVGGALSGPPVPEEPGAAGAQDRPSP